MRSSIGGLFCLLAVGSPRNNTWGPSGAVAGDRRVDPPGKAQGIHMGRSCCNTRVSPPRNIDWAHEAIGRMFHVKQFLLDRHEFVSRETSCTLELYLIDSLAIMCVWGYFGSRNSYSQSERWRWKDHHGRQFGRLPSRSRTKSTSH